MGMRRVLKKTGSIYLHCDHTAGHYLKILMDTVFGRNNFRNEIVWCYPPGGRGPKLGFHRKHDTIFYYGKTRGKGVFNRPYGELPEPTRKSYGKVDKEGRFYKEYPGGRTYLDTMRGRPIPDWWTDVVSLGQAVSSKERLGYPTQKPLALLERIIRASSNEGDLVLDPFCGCGTTVHAAESLNRRWVGIDISPFSTGLIRERLLENFPHLAGRITTEGVPHTEWEARELARRDKFEFEKWVCGAIGADGMFREPGERGADGGVDGIMEIYPIHLGQKAKSEYVIVQVKGGKVTPDAVRALYASVKHYEVRAGVLVCFGEYLGTVDNQRSKETFRDSLGEYPVIQGYSVAGLLANEPLNLPNYGKRRTGARLSL